MTQDGDKSEDKDGETAAPEVEAEVVSDDEAPASAFDDASPEVEDALEGAEAELGPRKTTLTPGVMLFFVFVAVALIALGAWRFMSGATLDAAPDENETADQETPVADVASMPVQAEMPPDPAPQEPSPSKTSNLPADNLKAPTDAAPGNDSFLPPVTESGANKLANTVEEGAKEALRRMHESEAAENAKSQPADETTGFEIAPADEEQTVAPGAADSETMTQPGTSSGIDSGAPSLEQDAAAENAAPSDEQQTVVPEKIANELQSLRAETERLENAFSAEQERNAALQEEIASLRDNFETALAARDQQHAEELASMRAEFKKIQNNQIAGATNTLKATLALNALRRKVDAGAPFANELTAMAVFAPEAAARLAPYAQDGVPAETELRDSFGAAARKGLAAAGREQAGGGVSGLVARAQGLVSVRPAAPQAGDSPRAVISRAEHAVIKGDLTYALSELDRLSPKVRETMKDWTEKARICSEAETVLAELAARFNDNGSR